MIFCASSEYFRAHSDNSAKRTCIPQKIERWSPRTRIFTRMISGEHSSTPTPPEWNGNPCYAFGKTYPQWLTSDMPLPSPAVFPSNARRLGRASWAQRCRATFSLMACGSWPFAQQFWLRPSPDKHFECSRLDRADARRLLRNWKGFEWVFMGFRSWTMLDLGNKILRFRNRCGVSVNAVEIFNIFKFCAAACQCF